MSLITDIFKRSQKNASFIHQDRSANALIEIKIDKSTTFLAIDSKKAIENIERSNDINQVQKWLDLLEPVKFIDAQNQNLEKQIAVLNCISMFCRDKEGKGVYPYQMQIVQHIFEKDENIPLRFGTAKVGNVLRPFIYFVRPKASVSLSEFLENNPILGMVQDNFNMQ